MAGIRGRFHMWGTGCCWAPGDTVVLIKTLDSLYYMSVSISGGM